MRLLSGTCTYVQQDRRTWTGNFDCKTLMSGRVDSMVGMAAGRFGSLSDAWRDYRCLLHGGSTGGSPPAPPGTDEYYGMRNVF